MTIPVYCNAIVNMQVEDRSRHLKSPIHCCEHWGHRTAFNDWLHQVYILTCDNIDEKHALMDLAVVKMQSGMLSRTRSAQLDEWILREKESDMFDAEIKNTIDQISHYEKFMNCMGSVSIVLLLVILGTTPFILSRGLMETLFHA